MFSINRRDTGMPMMLAIRLSLTCLLGVCVRRMRKTFTIAGALFGAACSFYTVMVSYMHADRNHHQQQL